MLLGKHPPDPPSPSIIDDRAPLRAPITVLRTDGNGGPKTFFGYAKNISRSGMMIGATSPKEPGTKFLLEIPLPEPINRTATCTCEVVWKREWAKHHPHEPGMGLRFLDLPDEIGTEIERWIETESLRQQLSA